MMDNDAIDELLEEDPLLLDNFDGFTRFTNTTSVYNMTFPAIAHLFTDEPLDISLTANEYFDLAYANTTFVNDLQDRGFTCNIYTEIGFSYRHERHFEGMASNLEESAFTFRPWRVPLQFFRLSLLKSAPLSLKNSKLLYPDLSYTGVGHWEGGATPYTSNDPQFYSQLIGEGLRPVKGPHFAFYHLTGFHYPWNMNARAELVAGEVDPKEQYLGSFFILEEYLEQLMALGLYEDATIIIIGDHPDHNANSVPTKPMLIGCFVKPSGAAGTPLQESSAPVSINNLRPTCVAAAGGNYRPWGQPYFEVAEDATVERHYYNRFTDDDFNHYLTHFIIHGDARVWENWEYIDTVPINAANWF